MPNEFELGNGWESLTIKVDPKVMKDLEKRFCGKGHSVDKREFPGIKAIYPNEKKGIVAVKFMDGKVYTAKCHAEDTFDLYVGVAICIASYTYGTKKQFHTIVNRKIK